MSEIPTYITDASVAAKWFFQAEPESQQAYDLLSDQLAGRASLIGPPHMQIEVIAAIRSKVLSREITPELGQRYVSGFLSMRFPTANPEGLLSVAYEYSQRFTISIYDAVYVALAQIEQAPLITADQNLLNALGSRFPFKLALEDYPTR